MSSQSPDLPPASAAQRLKRFAWVLVLVVLDLWSKSRVFAWLGGSEAPLSEDPCTYHHLRYSIFGDWFAFMLSENKGAAFGQLDSVPYLLIGGRVLAVVFLTYMVLRSSPARRLLNLALVLVLAGAVGNLYDNLFLAPPAHDQGHPFGYVRDFIDVYFERWQWHFPTFNVADSCITVGAVLLLSTGLFDGGKKEAKPAPKS